MTRTGLIVGREGRREDDFDSRDDVADRLIPLLGEPLPDIFSEPVRTEGYDDEAAEVREATA